jgi:hypothetical protein
MGVTVLGMDLVCEDSGHQVVPNGPNTCITPAAPSPLPVPYPIIASSSSLSPGTKKVKQAGKKILNSKGKVKSCNGNEAGTQKDVSSFVNMKKSWSFPAPATSVHFEGAVVAITGNSGMGNDM